MNSSYCVLLDRGDRVVLTDYDEQPELDCARFA